MKAPGCKASLVKPSENKGHYNIRSYKSQGIFSSWDCQPLAQLREKLQSSSAARRNLGIGNPKGGRNRTTHVPSWPFRHSDRATIQAGDTKSWMFPSLYSEGKKSGSSSSSSPHCCEESTGPCSTFSTAIKTIPKHIQSTLNNGILTCQWLLLAHDANTLAIVLGLTSKYHSHKLPPAFDVYLAAITNFYDCDSRSHKGVWSPDF